jgi:hypothetical protein
MPKVSIPPDHPIVRQVERLSRLLGFTEACCQEYRDEAKRLRQAIRVYLGRGSSRTVLEKLCDDSEVLEGRIETVLTKERKIVEGEKR